MKAKLITAALILLSAAASLACADPGLARYESPTPTPTPPLSRIYRDWAAMVCGFAPRFEAAANGWVQALETTSAPELEALRDELLRLVLLDLLSTSGASQTLGLLYTATTTSPSEWYGYQDFMAPPGVAGYERTLLDLVLDYEPVLNYAEAEILQAQSLEDLEATHATVKSAWEQMITSAREAAAGLDPEALRALQSVDECAFILGPGN